MTDHLHPDPDYPPHPLAEFVPGMSDDEFLALRKSIRAHGLLPGGEIVLHQGMVLDGRHRLRACLAEGVEPRFREYEGGDPRGYAMAMITRRHLDESRKALIAAGLLRVQAESGAPGWTHAQVSQLFGVGKTIILEAGRVLRFGVPRLRRMVENGQVTVKQAERVCRLPAAEQERVVAAGAYSVKAKAAQINQGKIRLPVPPDGPAGA